MVRSWKLSKNLEEEMNRAAEPMTFLVSSKKFSNDTEKNVLVVQGVRR